MSKILDAFRLLSQRNKDKQLCRAIDEKDAKKVQEAINAGADINSKYIECNERSFNSCFSEAVAHSSEDVINVMLNNEPDIKNKDRDILEVAIYNRFPNDDCISVIKTLIYAGADTSVVFFDFINKKHTTLLDTIEESSRLDPNQDARNKLFEIAKLLRTYGAKTMSELELSKKPQGPKKTAQSFNT